MIYRAILKLLILCCVCSLRAQAQGDSINLRDRGFPTTAINPKGFGDYLLRRQLLQIRDDGTIYVGFQIQHHSHGALVTRTDPHLWLHVYSFKNGQQLGYLEVPGFDGGVRILALSSGQVLIYSGTQFVLADGALHILNTSTPQMKTDRVLSDPAHSRLLVREFKRGRMLQLQLPSLSLLPICNTDADSISRDSDISAVQFDTWGQNSTRSRLVPNFKHRQILIRRGCDETIPAFDYVGDPSRPTLLSDTKFVLSDNFHLRIVDGGKLICDINSDAKFDFPIMPNFDGSRFAVAIVRWRGGNEFLHISGRKMPQKIEVFDSKGTLLHRVAVSPKLSVAFDFSLSPDGHLLALLQDGVVEIRDISHQ